MSFLVTFDSLLTPRINRIRRAFTRRDREELVTALLSLHASSAMIGAQQLHATTTRALTADPIQDQPAKPVLDRLTTQAQDFTEAVDAFVTSES